MNDARLLTLELAPSWKFAGVIFAVHALAGISFLTSLTAWPGAMLAALIVGLGGAAAWDRALLRGARSPRVIELRPTGEAVVRLRGGESAQLTALQGIGVTRFWVALGTALPARRSILVLAGMLGEEGFRCLRLWALWGKVPGKVPGVAPGQLPA